MRLSMAERFVLIRKRMNLTQTRLAQLLSVSRRTVSRVESGRNHVQPSTIERFKMLEQRQRESRHSRRRRVAA